MTRRKRWFAGAVGLLNFNWSDKRLRISHFRTKEQDEVDLVIEDQRGQHIWIQSLQQLYLGKVIAAGVAGVE